MTSAMIRFKKCVLSLTTLALIAGAGVGSPASESGPLQTQGLPAATAKPLPAPGIHWSFDDPEPAATKDVAGNINDVISGHYTKVKGVSGNSVRLDGYTFCLQRPAKQVPALGPSFAVDAWIAQAAYPWNWAPVVTQLKEGVNGFYFGVGPRGQFGMDITINDERYRCVSEDFVLPLRQWSHVSAVVKNGDGVYLYLNGRPAGFAPLKKAFRQAKDSEMRVGMNYTAVKPSNQIGDHGTQPFWYSVDGILDEVRVFGEALSEDLLKTYVESLGKPAAPTCRSGRCRPVRPEGKSSARSTLSCPIIPNGTPCGRSAKTRISW